MTTGVEWLDVVQHLGATHASKRPTPSKQLMLSRTNWTGHYTQQCKHAQLFQEPVLGGHVPALDVIVSLC